MIICIDELSNLFLDSKAMASSIKWQHSVSSNCLFSAINYGSAYKVTPDSKKSKKSSANFRKSL